MLRIDLNGKVTMIGTSALPIVIRGVTATGGVWNRMGQALHLEAARSGADEDRTPTRAVAELRAERLERTLELGIVAARRVTNVEEQRVALTVEVAGGGERSVEVGGGGGDRRIGLFVAGVAHDGGRLVEHE